jgi:hypothetical protein
MWVEFGHLYLEAPRIDVVQPRPSITSLSQLCNTTNMFYYKQGCHVLQFCPRASVAGIGEQTDLFILITVE